MKRLLVVLVVLSLCSAGAFAASDYATLSTDFQTFATDVANTLPFNALIGNTWSDAYIGQLLGLPPHFGIGVTAGVTTIPFATMRRILEDDLLVGMSQLSAIAQFGYGFPIPAYTVDVRIGGFVLPFDLGLKVGYLPPDVVKQYLPNMDVQYLLAGADIRWAILQDNFLIPALSVGIGYSFMKGGISLPGLLGGNIALGSYTIPAVGTYNVAISDPAVNFNWTSNVIDLKVQISKSLLIITPYLGASAAYGYSSAGGGLSSKILINGSPATAQQITDLVTAIQAAGQPVPDMSTTGFTVLKDVPAGWAVRAFGGFSINLFFIRLDLNAMYNFTSGSYGGQANVRFQL